MDGLRGCNSKFSLPSANELMAGAHGRKFRPRAAADKDLKGENPSFGAPAAFSRR